MKNYLYPYVFKNKQKQKLLQKKKIQQAINNSNTTTPQTPNTPTPQPPNTPNPQTPNTPTPQPPNNPKPPNKIQPKHNNFKQNYLKPQFLKKRQQFKKNNQKRREQIENKTDNVIMEDKREEVDIKSENIENKIELKPIKKRNNKNLVKQRLLRRRGLIQNNFQTTTTKPQINFEKGDYEYQSYVREFMKDQNIINKPKIIPIQNKLSNIPKQLNQKKFKFIQIYGPFNTGTNLLVNLMQNIFHYKIPEAGSTHYWKHSTVLNNYANTFHICITKNPFSWFESLKKESYTLKWNKNISILNQRVVLESDKKYIKPRPFPSITNLWTFYYQTYINFQKNYPHNTIFILYEDLIYNTDNIFENISKIINIPLPNDYENIKNNTLKKPAKQHGNCNNINKALTVNQCEYLFSKYNKDEVNKIFNCIQLGLIKEEHKNQWSFSYWINHFNKPSEEFNKPSEDSNAPSIQP